MIENRLDRYRNKRVLIVGLGRTGFALINFFNQLNCEIRVTDTRPIFDLNKAVKKLKKIRPTPEMTFGEHREEDFLDADVIVYSKSVNSELPQLELARMHGKEVCGQLELAHKLCTKPIIAVCGAFGRTTVTHMIGHCLRSAGKTVFVGGNGENPFINLWTQFPDGEVDYVVVEVHPLELLQFKGLSPHMAVFTNLSSTYPEKRFRNYSEYVETQVDFIKNMKAKDHLIVNFDKLSGHNFFSGRQCTTYWYSRKSFITQGVINETQGTHFHDKRIHSNIHCHSEFRVSKMNVVGSQNRENLLAAITVCKALQVDDTHVQDLIVRFPGIPHRLEFVMEKNGVRFYNDAKSEVMQDMMNSVDSFKESIILVAGGKDTEQDYESIPLNIKDKVRVLVLVGECKERLNRYIGESTQTYLVGSFEESILLAYQKSRTGDTIVLSPGNSSSDVFRDYVEKGNYFKKLVYQL